MPIVPALDAWAPCATLVWCALALGHFFEGSDPGMPAAHGLVMPGDSLATYPVPLFAALLAAGLTAWLYRRLARHKAHTAALALMAAGLGQYLLSFLRQPGLESVGRLDGLEWVSLGMFVGGALLLALA